jgi:hypothetical protein
MPTGITRSGSPVLRLGFFAPVKPEAHTFHEVKPGGVHNDLSPLFLFGTEEDCGGKDPLACSFNPAVLGAILAESEVVKFLSRAAKVNNPTLLPLGKGCHPDGNQTVLAVGSTAR